LPGILTALEKEQVQGLFFWQSNHLYPSRPWQRVLDEGHEIGTHGLRHRKLTKLNREQQFEDIGQSKQKLEQLIKQSVAYFRPAFGLYNEDTIACAEALDLKVMLWQVASWDWKLADRPEQIIHNVTQHVQPGDIILLHELPQTLAILPELIQELKIKGLSLKKPI
jgi:peptidoglycan/xylan/chitin deacetylase (PgdA/CDA1 family)